MSENVVYSLLGWSFRAVSVISLSAAIISASKVDESSDYILRGIEGAEETPVKLEALPDHMAFAYRV